MEDFLLTFFSGIWDFFQLSVPIINITFWQLFCGFFILKCVIVAIKMIFGFDHGKDGV